MTIRDLLVHIDQTQAAQVRLEAGLKLAERFGAHLTALYLAAEPFMRSAAGFHLPADVVREHLRHAEAEAEPVFAAARQAAEQRGVELETRLETGSLDRSAGDPGADRAQRRPDRGGRAEAGGKWDG